MVSWSFTTVSGATQYEYVVGASSISEPVSGTSIAIGSGLYSSYDNVVYFYSNGGQPYTEGSVLRIWIRAKNSSGVGPWVTATHTI